MAHSKYTGDSDDRTLRGVVAEGEDKVSQSQIPGIFGRGFINNLVVGHGGKDESGNKPRVPVFPAVGKQRDEARETEGRMKGRHTRIAIVADALCQQMLSADGFGDDVAKVAAAPVGKPYCVVGSGLEGYRGHAPSAGEDPILAVLSLVGPAPRIVRAVVRQPLANDIAEGQLVDDTESMKGCTCTSANRHRSRWNSGSAGDYGEGSGRRTA
ncbi:hypothetical protein DFH09DRAFT_1095514 [Mycena vulgaris]|nr:hypothetical protein DFH09DRAFT_1095514 [Mycena vulgaris]